MDPEAVENAQFICDICEHVLIDTVETACGHTYCKYCLYMWKKHDVNMCPNTFCQKDMGKVILRPDVDKYIQDFFATANPLAQEERSCFLKARKKDIDIPDLEKVLFRTRNFQSGRKLLDDLPRCSTSRLPAVGQRTNLVSQRSGQVQVQETYQKLNKETKTLAGELKGTYNKVLDLGASINAEEDSLASQFFSRDLHVKAEPINDRPCTASPGFGVGVTKIAHRPRDKSEVDELLKETSEIIKIERFLKKFSFENITQMEEPESQAQADIHKDALMQLDEFIEEGSKDGRKKGSTTATTDIPDESIPGFKVHQEVKNYMANNKLKTKVTPVVPRTDKDSAPPCTPRDPKTPRGAERPDPELERCRAALIKIKNDLSQTRLEEQLTKTKKVNSALPKSSTSKMAFIPVTQITGTKITKPKKSMGPETKKPSTSKCQVGSGDAPSATRKLTDPPCGTKGQVGSTDKKINKLPKPPTSRPNSKGQI